MFNEFSQIYLKKDVLLKSKGRMYSIHSSNKLIGTIEETLESTKNLRNQILKLFTLYSAASLELKILNKKANLIGTIKKERGFYKDFKLFSPSGNQIATIQPTVKMKSSTFAVKDVNGIIIYKAVGNYGTTDFSIIDCKTNKQISTIKRSSFDYSKIIENLQNNDGYLIDNINKEESLTLSLLAMCIMVDIYIFHN